ncbi:MAG TPA: PQQ-binding-like beta-propeller repeat protein, partial [Myxococcaceae bacterium]|nr:PQQ-binding-like beta-propeller repeat protein [Myxococcaceae bacterium]
MAAGLAAVVSCNFDPTRTCQTNADCVGGATCDPGTGTCVQSGVVPVLELTLGAPPSRTSSGSLTVLDPGFGADAGAAFRRDESTTVTVTSAATNVDAGSLLVTITGVGPGAAPVAVEGLVPCAGSPEPFCMQGTVSFGPPVPLAAFRGVMTVTATASDTSGNAATPASEAVPVTRWSWALQLGGPIRTSPAIGATGRIYVGTDSPDGRFYAITAQGTLAWAQPLDGGAFVASATVGAGGAGETVYVASAETGHCAALAVSGASGAVIKTCDYPATTGGGFFGSLALVQTNGVESGVGVCNDATTGVDGQLVSVRPTATSSQQCPATITAGFVAYPGGAASDKDDHIFYGGNLGVLRGFAFSLSGWNPNSWGGGTGSVLVGGTAIPAVANEPSGGFAVGSVKSRGAFAVSQTTGGIVGSAPDGGLATNPGSIVIGQDGVVFGNGDTT